MKKGDIDRFFRELGKKVRYPLKIYLTGGIASWFLGGARPTRDIDFGLHVSRGRWEESEKILNGLGGAMGIPLQFSEDIGRWSMIDLPNYEKTATPYKRFGKVSVYLLDVAAWSIGKIARYYRSDVEDLRSVLRRQRPDPARLVKFWAKALQRSPRSSDQFLFLKKAENFLKEYGREIWGKRYQADTFILSLKRSAIRT